MAGESTALDTRPLLAHLDAEGCSVESCRHMLEQGRDAIHARYLAGALPASILRDMTTLVDLVLTALWQDGGDLFDDFALVAVGGYGRGELHPYSDIDIAILTPDTLSGDQEDHLAAWVTRLWDLGLDIGSSVRTVADCEREAANDITIITNLMEARLLVGAEALFDAMQAVIAPTRMWDSAAFFQAKMDEQAQRHQRYHSNAYRLEPNVKESRGGLRDIQMISWVCQRQFGTHSLEDLIEHELLTPREFALLRDGLDVIWRIRYLLHRLAGRREDRLLFDYQRDIATAFGFDDPNGNQAIEQLMQRFYRSVMELQRLNEILLQGIGGIISGVTARSPIEPVNKRFQVRNGFLEVTHDHVFMHYPPAIFEIFLIFGTTPSAKKVRANTVRLIRASLPLINARFRSDPVVKRMFLRIFSEPAKLTRKIRMMNRYGVLAAYLPAFDAIVGRMQYDLFHIYTVDEHITRVIRNVRRMALEEFNHELPECSRIMQQNVRKPELLYITALFHDIAKGRGGDHSILGAEDVERFGRQHGFDEHDTELVSWTVRYHLEMSLTAQRKDISDPDVQLEFAHLVGTQEHLDFLYLLTVADIRATNPELWTSFKASLLQSLYVSTRRLLQQGLDRAPDHDDMIAERQQVAMAMLRQQGATDARIQTLWNSLDEDYFRQHDANEIARHTLTVLSNLTVPGVLVTMAPSHSRGSMEVMIFVADDDALFAKITETLGQLNLNVLSANINTTETGHALDIFQVLETDGSLITDEARINEIRTSLLDVLSTGAQPLDDMAGTPRTPRRLRHFSIPVEIDFASLPGDLTEVRIVAGDRPGILSSIGRVFLDAGVSVQAARITTLGERIDDVFLVRNQDGSPLESDAQRERLARLLTERL